MRGTRSTPTAPIAFPGFFDRATASYDGRTGQIFGEAGYGFAFGNVAVEPFAGGAWVSLQTDAATERGGAAALNLAANSFEVGYSTLGVRAASMSRSRTTWCWCRAPRSPGSTRSTT